MMRNILLFAFIVYSALLLGQTAQDQGYNFRKSFYCLGAGPSTIGGLSFTNELGFSNRKSTFSFHLDFHRQMFVKSQGHFMRDFFINVGITYGRMKYRNDYYYELNVGPVFYGYFDEVRTGSSFFGMTTYGYRTREYGGFGALFQLDVGKQSMRKVALDYSVFVILNSHLPMAGITARMNLRLRLMQLPPKS